MRESNLGSLQDEESEEQLRPARELWALKENMEIQIQTMSLRKVEGDAKGK